MTEEEPKSPTVGERYHKTLNEIVNLETDVRTLQNYQMPYAMSIIREKVNELQRHAVELLKEIKGE